MSDQSALQVEAAERRLPRVQVGQSGAHVVAGVPPVPPRLRQLGAHLAPQQARRDGGVLGDADPADAGSRASASSPRRTASRAAWSATIAASRRCRAAAARRRPRRRVRPGRAAARPMPTSASTSTASARRPAQGWPGCGSAARRAGRLPGRGRDPRAAGSSEASARTAAWKDRRPSGAVRRRGRLQRHDRVACPARGGQHLGAVLLAYGPGDRRQRGEHVAGGRPSPAGRRRGRRSAGGHSPGCARPWRAGRRGRRASGARTGLGQVERWRPGGVAPPQVDTLPRLSRARPASSGTSVEQRDGRRE